jgi:hypothetical protein
MIYDIVMGVDVGVNGGIAWTPTDVSKPVEKAVIESMPKEDAEIAELFKDVLSGADNPVAYVEQVTGYVPNRPQPASRSFKLGYNAGLCVGVLHTLGVNVVMVRPQEWQKGLGFQFEKGTGYSTRKSAFYHSSKLKFPHLAKKITMKTADALHILDYGLHQLL